MGNEKEDDNDNEDEMNETVNSNSSEATQSDEEMEEKKKENVDSKAMNAETSTDTANIAKDPVENNKALFDLLDKAGKRKEQSFECEKCGETFAMMTKLKRHSKNCNR